MIAGGEGAAVVLVMSRSALEVDVLVVLSVLLPASGSGVEELTVAVLVMDCGSTSLASSTVRVTVVFEPSVIAVAWVQVTVPELAPQDQSVPVAPT